MTNSSSSPNPPRKIRTWWHPLLASMLRWQLGSHYELQEEVSVGDIPLQLDLLLIKKERGEVSDDARRVLAGLIEYLGKLTLIEFKSPSDWLQAGDYQKFLAYKLLYRIQNHPLLEPNQLHLLVIAPNLTEAYRQEMKIFEAAPEQQEPGIWRIRGIVHPMWVLETEVLAGLNHPLLTLVSPQFLKKGPETYEKMHQGGYTRMVVYMAQQMHQFRLQGKEFAMQHLGTEEEIHQSIRDFLATLPVEERLEGLSPKERLEGLSPDERLEGLSPEKRLEGLSPEKRLAGLSPEELEHLRKVLQRQTKSDNPSDLN